MIAEALGRCIICSDMADGFIEDSGFGWHEEENNRLYLCSKCYTDIYKSLGYTLNDIARDV